MDGGSDYSKRLRSLASGERFLKSRPGEPPPPPVSDSPNSASSQARPRPVTDLFFGPRAQQPSGIDIDPALAQLLISTWRSFFACFREDEKDIELPRYRDQALLVQAVIDRLGPDSLPDLFTCRQMMFLLMRFIQERFNELDGRIQDLKDQSRQLEGQLMSSAMNSSFAKDTQERTRLFLKESCRMLGITPTPEQLEQPDALAAQVQDAVRRQQQFLTALVQIADPSCLPLLPPDMQERVRKLRDQDETGRYAR